MDNILILYIEQHFPQRIILPAYITYTLQSSRCAPYCDKVTWTRTTVTKYTCVFVTKQKSMYTLLRYASSIYTLHMIH